LQYDLTTFKGSYTLEMYIQIQTFPPAV